MAQIREIKCPNCGEWTIWEGDVDDRCVFCGGFLEAQRFSREVEKKVNDDLLKENDYLFVQPGDRMPARWLKKWLNSARWVALFVQIAFFLLVSGLLVLISIIAV